MLVAEVSSRFNNVGQFVKQVEKLGFKIKHQVTCLLDLYSSLYTINSTHSVLSLAYIPMLQVIVASLLQSSLEVILYSYLILKKMNERIYQQIYIMNV